MTKSEEMSTGTGRLLIRFRTFTLSCHRAVLAVMCASMWPLAPLRVSPIVMGCFHGVVHGQWYCPGIVG